MGRKNKKDASLGKHAVKQNASHVESAASGISVPLSEYGDTAQEGAVQQGAPQETAAMQPESRAGAFGAGMLAGGYAGFESSFDSLTKEKRRRGGKALKVLGVVFGSIIGLAVIAYLAGCLFFIDRFWPNTTIGNYDISMKSLSEAEPILNQGITDYQVKVEGQGLSFTISAKDADLFLDAHAILSEAVNDVKPWLWPVEIFEAHDASDSLTASYGKSGIDESIRAKVDEFNETATQPVDATISFDEATRSFQIVPEVLGTALDPHAVIKAVDAALVKLSTSVKITEQQLAYPLVGEANAALRKACDSANVMIAADMSFTMDGSPVAVLDPGTIASWVRLGDDLNVVFDEGALNGWIDGIAAGCNTIGTERTYARPDGKTVTVAGGSYGWKIDSEAFGNLVREGVSNGQVGTFDIPIIQRGTGFNGIGGQDWGARYCDIDLSEQHARYYDDAGTMIWESDIISGKPNGKHNTPTGVYYLNMKESPSKLIGEIDPATKKPEYETVVTYWMPFVGNAVGLHDATWQPGFGGTMYANGYGSHGCINLPYSAAQSLYGIISVGDPVICHW